MFEPEVLGLPADAGGRSRTFRVAGIELVRRVRVDLRSAHGPCIAWAFPSRSSDGRVTSDGQVGAKPRYSSLAAPQFECPSPARLSRSLLQVSHCDVLPPRTPNRMLQTSPYDYHNIKRLIVRRTMQPSDRISARCVTQLARRSTGTYYLSVRHEYP